MNKKVKVNLFRNGSVAFMQNTTTPLTHREKTLWNGEINGSDFRIVHCDCLDVTDDALYLNGRDTRKDFKFLELDLTEFSYSFLQEIVEITNTLTYKD